MNGQEGLTIQEDLTIKEGGGVQGPEAAGQGVQEESEREWLVDAAASLVPPPMVSSYTKVYSAIYDSG